MSGRDRSSLLRLPLRMILVLVVCAGSLAVHFVVEGLAPAHGQFVFELTAQGGHSHSAHESCEDDFVFSSLGHLCIEYFLARPVFQAPARSSSVLITPLLPPPNS